MTALDRPTIVAASSCNVIIIISSNNNSKIITTQMKMQILKAITLHREMEDIHSRHHEELLILLEQDIAPGNSSVFDMYDSDEDDSDEDDAPSSLFDMYDSDEELTGLVTAQNSDNAGGESREFSPSQAC